MTTADSPLSRPEGLGTQSGTASPLMRSGQPASASGINHLASLDSWRGIAALLVMLGHVCWTHPVFNSELLRRSYLMVDFFFILSGFVIALNYGDRLRNTTDLGKFVWLRFWRLYPLHAFFLIVFAGIEFIKYLASNYFGLVANTPAFSTNNLDTFLLNALLIQGLNTTTVATFNGSSWSISTEFYTYLLFAALVLISARKSIRIIVSLSIFPICLFLILRNGEENLNFSYDFGFIRCVGGFFLGVVACDIYNAVRKHSLVSSSSAGLLWLQIISVAGFIGGIWAEEQVVSDFLMIAPIFMIILSFAIGHKTSLSALLCIAPLRWLGAISYSIYMSHEAVLWCYNQILRVIFGIPDLEGWYRDDQAILHTPSLLGGVFLVVAVATVLFVSHWTYRLVEEPWRLWSRRFVSKRRV